MLLVVVMLLLWVLGLLLLLLLLSLLLLFLVLPFFALTMYSQEIDLIRAMFFFSNIIFDVITRS